MIIMEITNKFDSVLLQITLSGIHYIMVGQTASTNYNQAELLAAKDVKVSLPNSNIFIHTYVAPKFLHI